MSQFMSQFMSQHKNQIATPSKEILHEGHHLLWAPGEWNALGMAGFSYGGIQPWQWRNPSFIAIESSYYEFSLWDRKWSGKKESIFRKKVYFMELTDPNG